MDSETEQHLLAEIKELRTRLEATEKRLEEANRLCHRVGIIRSGKIVAVDAPEKLKVAIDRVHRILKLERDLVIQSRPLEATAFQVENIRWAYVFYESGLSINVLYTLDGDKPKRAVGFKLSDGMEVPAELAQRFKFAKQKSKLAGTIRGSFFVIKGEY
mgnify:CR=1 FL=1